MRTGRFTVALTLSLLAVSTGTSRPALAQWRAASPRPCARSDTLFGRLWRSHQSVVRHFYSSQRDTTTIVTPDRKVSWHRAGSTRLVGTEAQIRFGGRGPELNARIELYLRFVDSIYRSASQARLTLQIDDSGRVEIEEPQVDYPMGASVEGTPIVVSVLLTPEQSLALARAREVRGTMGPYEFRLYDWELWDINSVYRASFCGFLD